MKAIRKRARREIDAVSIIEWRNQDERFFALLRRPEGGSSSLVRTIFRAKTNPIGLLAGLYEFPSSENIENSVTELLEIPHSILDDLLASPPSRHGSSNKGHDDNAKFSDSLRITNICHIGDIVHVFSHIKKTYRILWVVLDGGSSPPSFSKGPGHEKKRRADNVSGGAAGTRVKWIPEKDVTDAKCVDTIRFYFLCPENLLIIV